MYLVFTGTTNLSKTISQGTLEDGRRSGRLRERWVDNVEQGTFWPMPELLTMASRRKDWNCLSARPTTQSVKGMNGTDERDGRVRLILTS